LLRAASHRLYRSEEISIERHDIPASGNESVAQHAATFVDLAQPTIRVVRKQILPGALTVAGHDGVAVLQRFLGKDRRVWTAEDNGRLASTCLSRQPVSVNGIERVNADSDEIAWVDVFER